MKRFLAVVLAVMMLSTLVVFVNAERDYEVVELLQFTTAPKIDGVITEAEWGKPTVRVQPDQKTTDYVDQDGVEEAEENIWFDLWLRWDANYYYIGMYLPDTTHYLPASETNLWNGDVVQMGFDPEGPFANEDVMEPWSDNYTNMAFGLVSGEGNTLSSWAWYGPSAGGQVEGAKYNIKRNGIYTTYELAIPWTAIGVENGVKVGDVYGATIARVMSDGDEDDPCNGWITWGTGILGKNIVDEEIASGSNGLLLSATPAVGATAPATSTTTAPAGTASAPQTADAGIIGIIATMAASAGAVLTFKKRK
ncbi:MAG: hypothetical protein E7588_03775 [Ruminococcaceae bacterium]|nr:hypothetical protein [Oscillospiraceae bacterium]